MKIDLSNLNKLVNPCYRIAFRFTGRYLVLYGGAGSGKSWAIAQKIIIRMLSENGHNILCMRKVGNTIHRSQFALLKATIVNWGLSDYFQINEADGKEKIICKLNGNQIIFSGADDIEKLKSIYNISSCWLEECSEFEFSDYLEVNRRLRGYQGKNLDGSTKYMQIMISFNPISALHWLKSHFVDRDYAKLYLSGENEALGHTESLKGIEGLILKTTYRDNHFIDSNYHLQMEELKEISEYDYMIYSEGAWGITGKTYFKAAAINQRIQELLRNNWIKRGYFEFKTFYDDRVEEVQIDDTSIKFIEDENGPIKIYEDVEEGYPYVIGGDTAGEGSDFNTGQVLNNVTDRQVATLKLNYDEDLYSRQMYCLGMYFNQALMALETNFSTHPMKVLTTLNYPNQYVRESRPDSFSGKMTEIFGFNTNKATRPDALGKLRTVVREKTDLIQDLDTLEEMSTFIINEKGRAEAALGKHDDLIMAYAIACYISFQQRTYVDVVHPVIDIEPEALKSNNKGEEGYNWNIHY